MEIEYPIKFLKIALNSGDNSADDIVIPLDSTVNWGIPLYIIGNDVIITKVLLLWYSISNNKYYYINRIVNIPIENDVIRSFGVFPNGLFAIWSFCERTSKLLFSSKAYDITNYMMDLIKTKGYDLIVNSESLDIPISFDKDMQQFLYRYLILFEKWDDFDENWQSFIEEEFLSEFDYIEESLCDGTFDKLHDGGLMNYHEAGKPKKLAIKWHIKKSEYTAYFWFEDDEIRAIYDRFYGAHPETKTDFMIRIDSEKNKYELALYRYGLKEPQVISESAYQLLVFKNKFEYYRSENYNQPKGAWIW